MATTTKMTALLIGTAVIAGGIATTADAQRAGGRMRDRNQSNTAPAPAPAPGAPTAAPTVSRPFSAAFQPVNAAITANNLAAADAGLPALRAAATTPYEIYVASQTDFRIASAQNNVPRQLTALDSMADSNGAPAAEAPRVFVAAGQLAYNANDFAKAARRFERAIALNATAENLDDLYLASLLRSNQIDAGIAFARQHIAARQAAGGQPTEQFYGIAARQLQESNRPAELLEMLALRANAYPNPLNLRSLGIIYLQANPSVSGLTLDVMRLLSDANALNDRRQYVEYAQEAAAANLPGEAVAVIRAGRTAGRIPQPDTFFDELYRGQNAEIAEDRGSLGVSARRAAQVAEPRLATLTGDAYLAYGDYPQALEMYALALTKGGADTNLLNTRIGIARLRAGDFAGARTAFRAVQGNRTTAGMLGLAVVGLRERPAAPAAPAATPTPATPTPAPATPPRN